MTPIVIELAARIEQEEAAEKAKAEAVPVEPES